VLHGVSRGAFAIRTAEPVVLGGAEAELVTEIASDISFALERLEQERERGRAEAALRESEARLRRLYEESPVGYQSLDASGRILEVNPAWLALLGYTREGVIGRHFGEFLTPGERTLFEARLPAFRDRGTMHGAEYRMVARGGELLEVSFDGVFVRSRDGEPAYTHCVMQNLSERRKAEEEMRRLEARFHQAQKMESVGRLAGGVAHDFNNMLQVILSYATLAAGRTDPTDRVNGYLQQIRVAAERSAELTQQLLAFARRQVIAPRRLELNETVEGMLTMLRRLIGEDIRIDWQPDPSPWAVRMDPAQVGQVLTNLCVNARDAIDGVGRISISLHRAAVDAGQSARHPGSTPGDHVRLDVEDSGCGMDRATIERIFEPFFTTKGEGHGTGLGLATVYGIVTQNRGFIEVDSEPGRGSTFRVHLPRYADGEVDAAAAPSAAPPTQRGSGEMVLVVEDEPAILEITAEMLRGLGYEVLTAGSPRSALALAAERLRAIDLLLTDVIMPDMNGRDLLARLRERHPGVRCLYMSGYTADVIARRGELEEDTSFIQKPFAAADLGAKVLEVLRQT
jgi:PAS domain S-box-containing protein